VPSVRGSRLAVTLAPPSQVFPIPIPIPIPGELPCVIWRELGTDKQRGGSGVAIGHLYALVDRCATSSSFPVVRRAARTCMQKRHILRLKAPRRQSVALPDPASAVNTLPVKRRLGLHLDQFRVLAGARYERRPSHRSLPAVHPWRVWRDLAGRARICRRRRWFRARGAIDSRRRDRYSIGVSGRVCKGGPRRPWWKLIVRLPTIHNRR